MDMHGYERAAMEPVDELVPWRFLFFLLSTPTAFYLSASIILYLVHFSSSSSVARTIWVPPMLVRVPLV